MLTETKLENNKDFFADLKISFIRFFKLLKYELSASCRTLVPIYCAVLIIGVLTRFALASKVSFENSSGSFFFEAEGIMSFVCFSLLTASVCISIVILCGRFKKSFFGSEAYLNFSLPVGISNHLASKLVSCLIWGLICTIVGFSASFTAWNGWEDFLFWFSNEKSLDILRMVFGYLFWLSSGIMLFFVAMCTSHVVSNFKRVAEIMVVVVGLCIETNVCKSLGGFSSSDMIILFAVPLIFSAIWFTICYLILRYKLNIE